MSEKTKKRQNRYVIFVILAIVVIVLLVFFIQNKFAPQKTLSDLQAEACKIADEAGTCETRLADLGLVLKEECCEVLGKCC
jgi:hypothetical protein